MISVGWLKKKSFLKWFLACLGMSFGLTDFCDFLFLVERFSHNKILSNKAYLFLRVNSSFNGQRDCIDMMYVSQVLWARILELDRLGWKPSSLVEAPGWVILANCLPFPMPQFSTYSTGIMV